MEVSFNLACSNLLFALQGVNFVQMCRFLAEQGYHGLELAPDTMVPKKGGNKKVRNLSGAEAKAVSKLASDNGLRITGFQQVFTGLAPTDYSMTSPNSGAHTAMKSQVKSLLATCSDLGGSVVGIGSPAHRAVPVNGTPMSSFQSIIDIFSATRERARQLNVQLLIEPLGLGSFISTPLEALLILEQLGYHSHLGYLYDTAAAHQQHGGAVGVLEQLFRMEKCQLKHVHFREVTGGAPGTGEIDFTGVIQVLRANNYSRWATVEPVVASPEQAPDAFDHARNAMQHLKGCMS